MDFTTFQMISRSFDHEMSIEGENIPRDQRAGYIECTSRLEAFCVAYVPATESGILERAVKNAMTNVVRHFESVPEDSFSEHLPFIRRRRLKELFDWIAGRQPNEETMASLLAGFLYETRRVQNAAKSLKSDVGSTLVESELASYVAWKNFEDNLPFFEQRVETIEVAFNAASRPLLDSLKDKLQEVTNSALTCQKAQSEALSALDEIKKFTGAIELESANYIQFARSETADFREQLTHSDAALNALKEGVATMSAKKLWDQRARSSRTAFWCSAGLLAALLLGLPLGAAYNLDWTLATLRHIGEATMQGLPPQPTDMQLAITAISRLVVITLPIVLYLWVIRLVVRFNSRALVLLDDARQRHTMMDTYFHLIEQQAALKEDRALVLAALFRPTPGQGPDNVEPPNFTELMDKAMSK